MVQYTMQVRDEGLTLIPAAVTVAYLITAIIVLIDSGSVERGL